MPVTRTSGSSAGLTGNQIKDNTIQGRDIDESTLSLSFIVDGDGDTKVQCEESADEDKIRFDTGGSERVVIDENFKVGSSNNSHMLFVDGDTDTVVIGAIADPGTWATVPVAGDGIHVQDKNIIIQTNSADGGSSVIAFNKSRHAADGGQTAVTADDTLGEVVFLGSDGTNFEPAGQIKVEVDGAPGNNDMPGRLVFSTTTDGSTSLGERMRIDSRGNVGIGTTNPKCTLDYHMPAGYFGALSNDEGGGEVVQFGSATGLSAGALYYLDGNGTWIVSDADSVASGERLVGIALGGSAASGLLVKGYFDVHSKMSNFVSGKAVYISNSAGFMDTVAPSGVGDIIRVVGYCTDTPNVIRFSPDGTWVEL